MAANSSIAILFFPKVLFLNDPSASFIYFFKYCATRSGFSTWLSGLNLNSSPKRSITQFHPMKSLF